MYRHTTLITTSCEVILKNCESLTQHYLLNKFSTHNHNFLALSFNPYKLSNQEAILQVQILVRHLKTLFFILFPNKKCKLYSIDVSTKNFSSVKKKLHGSIIVSDFRLIFIHTLSWLKQLSPSKKGRKNSSTCTLPLSLFYL